MNRTANLPADRIEATIFDMDGVVIDSEPLHERAQEDVFARFGLDVPPAELATFKGRTEDDVFSDILDRYSDGDIVLETIVEAKHLAYQDLLADVEAVDGALDLIQHLHGRMPLALATSAVAVHQQFVFEHLKLGRYFSAIITAGDVVNPKPHPEPYLLAASRLGVPPEHCLVIEDSVFGVRSGLAAGCVVAALVGTFARPVLEAEQPHAVVDHLAELQASFASR